MERQAEEIFAYLDEIGGGSMLEGVIAGIDDNWFQRRIGDSAYDLERSFNSGDRIIVGVNAYTEGNDDELELLRITGEDEDRQRKRLNAVRAERNQQDVDDALARLRADAADPNLNLMPTLIDASRAYVTLGEMMGAMAEVFGRHVEVPVF
jgi:methylmalonyl-CoA mutase N-terminal domain/subunit